MATTATGVEIRLAVTGTAEARAALQSTGAAVAQVGAQTANANKAVASTAGALVPQYNKAQIATNELRRSLASNVAGLAAMGSPMTALIAQLDNGVTKLRGNWGELAKGLASGVLIAGAGAAITAVIGKARELNGVINQLRADAGQPVQGFWSNWLDGLKELVGGVQEVNVDALVPTAQQIADNRANRARQLFGELTHETTAEEKFTFWFQHNKNATQEQMRDAIAGIKQQLSDEKFEVEINERVTMARAGGNRDTAAEIAQEFLDTETFAGLGATNEQRMAAIEGMLAGRVEPPVSSGAGSIAGNYDDERLAGERDALRQRIEQARQAEQTARDNAERDAINKEAKLGDLRGQPNLVAELLQKYAQAGRLTDLGGESDERRARAEGIVAQMTEAAQKQIDAQQTAINAWADLAKQGPQFASADVVGTAEAQRAINEQKFGGEQKQIAERQLQEQMRASRSLEEIVRQRVVIATASLN